MQLCFDNLSAILKYAKKRKQNMLRKIIFFTLVELLITIAIIAILASLLLPSLKQVKNKVEASKCASNLKQMGIIFCSYVGDFSDSYPPFNYEYYENYYGGEWPTKYYWNWGYGMWNSGYISNPAILQCPTASKKFKYKYSSGSNDVVHRPNGSAQYLYIHYGYNYGYIGSSNQISGDSSPVPARVFQVKRPSSTILLGETEAYVDTDLYQGSYALPYNGLNISSIHNGGMNILWTDGHASYLSHSQTELNGSAASKNKYFSRN